MGCSLPNSSVHGIFQEIIQERIAILFTTPWSVAHQALPPIGFFRQEYWNGWPFPTSGDLPNPGVEPVSLVSSALAGGFFTTAPPGKLSGQKGVKNPDESLDLEFLII